ncbi:hypothetical protein [Acinetobacter sp. WCHAc060025]|uniref:hypothetical protein n=1 Tax=Acinetobacter sp. WCHAc060025 TaxID=2518625 RepID=UPI00102388A5|nr:hypothetical protein [Acinetobacter sp. WCHAc060025]RZG77432.1 hypothetical protein EXE09_03240 [Acinetobacter sp. WCHAc060025]
MKFINKLLNTIFILGIYSNTSFAENPTEKSITYAKASAQKVFSKIYSCEYKIFYTNLEKQKKFDNDEIAKSALPFIYSKNTNSIYQYEESPIIQPPKNLIIKVDFDLKMDNKAYNITITPSTDSASLDKSIQNAFSIAKFSTHKNFWWGNTLKLSDEIRLEKTENCQIRNIYNEEQLSRWRKQVFP